MIREQRIFLTEFWNIATAADDCISAWPRGRLLCVDWNSAAIPCVFMPYALANVNQIFATSGTLKDIWQEPSFAGTPSGNNHRQLGCEELIIGRHPLCSSLVHPLYRAVARGCDIIDRRGPAPARRQHTVPDWGSYLVAAAAAAFTLGVVNLLLRPLILLLALPLGLIATLIVGFFANAFALLIAARLIPELHVDGLLGSLPGRPHPGRCQHRD